MAWRIARDYAVFNPAVEAMMARAGWPYVLLRPPAVSRPLLVLADQTRAPALNEPYRAWAATPGAEVIDAERVRASAAPSDVAGHYNLPEREDLLRCKWFAQAAHTPVAVYGAETSGGAVGYEWCWRFAPDGSERAAVMVRRRREIRVVERRWLLLRRSVTRLVVESVAVDMTPQATTERPYPHALALFDDVAAHLGIDTPRGVFPPHRRDFDWQPYHVLARRQRGAP